jgi:hypothetical protein
VILIASPGPAAVSTEGFAVLLGVPDGTMLVSGLSFSNETQEDVKIIGIIINNINNRFIIFLRILK